MSERVKKKAYNPANGEDPHDPRRDLGGGEHVRVQGAQPLGPAFFLPSFRESEMGHQTTSAPLGQPANGWAPHLLFALTRQRREAAAGRASESIGPAAVDPIQANSPPTPPVCSGDGPRRPPGMAAVAGLCLPQFQLRDGRLPLLGRPLLGGLRRRRLRRPHPPLPLPPPARAGRPGTAGPLAQDRRLGPLHAPHAHVLVQGRRDHAALGAAARLGHGDLHHPGRILRLLPRTSGGALRMHTSPSTNTAWGKCLMSFSLRLWYLWLCSV